MKLTSNREVRQNETAVKVQGNYIRFIFNKYNSGRQITFELDNLFDSLEPKIISKNFKSNFVTFTFKKRAARKWGSLHGVGGVRPKSRKKQRHQSEEFESKKDYLKSLKKFGSSGRPKERNNRYMTADEENFDKYAVFVPEHDQIIEENDEGSCGSNYVNSHRMIPSTKEISKQVDQYLNAGGLGEGLDDFSKGDSTKITEALDNTEMESFMQNENMVSDIYAKKKNPKLYMNKNKKSDKKMVRQFTPEALKKYGTNRSNTKSGAKLYQNKNSKAKTSTYKNRYMQKSQERRDRVMKLKKDKSAGKYKRDKGSYMNKIQGNRRDNQYSSHEHKPKSVGISNRYASNQEQPKKTNYFNSWLNRTEDSEGGDSKVGSGEFDSKPENIAKQAFKKTLNNDLMTIDEIIALEQKEAKQNSKLRKAKEIREKKTRQAQKKSRSRQRRTPTPKSNGAGKNKSRTPTKTAKNREKEMDFQKFKAESKPGLSHHPGSKSGSSMPNHEKIPIATFTTRKGQFNKIFDLHKNEEITNGGQNMEETRHREKSYQELEKLKMSRKSVKNIEGLAKALIEQGSQGDLAKESFVENFPSNMPSNFPSNKDNQIVFGSKLVSKNNSETDEVEIKSNLVSIQSEAKNVNIFTEPARPQTKSNIELNGPEQGSLERSKSKPMKKRTGFLDKKGKNPTLRSRSTIRGGAKSTMTKTDRGLSQNLSNLAAQTVVSYDGPNVSVVSLKLREKRGEILDTFAQLNLDMAWVHRQCRYIDLHSTQGVLKFFELQNRLIVKLATKLRKEKNARFKVEKQCERMMDNFKKDLNK